MESVEVTSPIQPDKKDTPVIFDKDGGKGFESDNVDGMYYTETEVGSRINTRQGGRNQGGIEEVNWKWAASKAVNLGNINRTGLSQGTSRTRMTN